MVICENEFIVLNKEKLTPEGLRGVSPSCLRLCIFFMVINILHEEKIKST